MFKKPLILSSPQEREQLFHSELVRYGVQYQKAAKVAKMLATPAFDEQLTETEKQLVEEVCQQWLQQRKRLDLIDSILDEKLSGS